MLLLVRLKKILLFLLPNYEFCESPYILQKKTIEKTAGQVVVGWTALTSTRVNSKYEFHQAPFRFLEDSLKLFFFLFK